MIVDCSEGVNGKLVFLFFFVSFIYVLVIHITSQSKNENAVVGSKLHTNTHAHMCQLTDDVFLLFFIWCFCAVAMYYIQTCVSDNHSININIVLLTYYFMLPVICMCVYIFVAVF